MRVYSLLPNRLLLVLLTAFGLGALLRPTTAQAQQAIWARQIESTANNVLTAVDAAGNTYLSGQFVNNTYHIWGYSCSGVPHVSGDHDTFLAKFDAAGTVVWLRESLGGSHEYITALTTDAAGHVFAVLRVEPNALQANSNLGTTFGSFTVNKGGHYLLDFDGAGVVQSSRLLHRWKATGPRLAIKQFVRDAAGTSYFVTYNNGLDSLAASALSPSALSTHRVLRLAAAGPATALDVLAPGSPGGLTINDMALGPQGDVYLAGEIGTGGSTGGTTFNTTPATTLVTAHGDAYVARVTSTGHTRWAVQSTPGANTWGMAVVGMAVAVDAGGNVYLGGLSGASELTFGSLPIITFPPTPGVTPGSGGFVVKLSPTGTPLWLRGHWGGATGAGTRFLTLDGAGNPIISGSFNGLTHTFDGGLTLINPNLPWSVGSLSADDAAFLVSYDPAGALRWGRTSDPVAGATMAGANAVYLENMQLDAAGNLMLLLSARADGARFDGLLLPNGRHLIRFAPAAALRGTVYLDTNGNGAQDAGEGPFPQQLVVADTRSQTGNSTFVPDGSYTAYLAGGPYALAVAAPPHYVPTQPAAGTYNGTLPVGGAGAASLNFGLRPVPNQPDVRVAVTALTPARPGFLTTAQVVVENVGTTPLPAGTVTLTLDARVNYVASVPAATVGSGARTLTWTYPALAPFGRFAATASYSLPLNVAPGAVLTASAAAALTADVVPTDNTAPLTQAVVGILSTNNVEVNYTQLTPNQVAAGQPLDYTIRFQNVGADSAFVVVIEDSLSAPHLRLTTVQYVAASHNCTWTLDGRGHLAVRFPGMRLPSRTQNQVRSQGFVRFRVVPQPGLPTGTLIPNRARLFFDYSAPLATNQATTLVQMPNGLVAAEPGEGDAFMRLYPNPATGRVTIEAAPGATATLLDVAGRVVLRPAPTTAPLALDGVAPGLYVVRVALPDGTASSRRLVVQ